MHVEQGILAGLIRALGFLKKELVSVLRQPRLILTLIIGPFAILLIFGLGYRNTPAPFRTLLVLGSEEAQLAADREDLGDAFGSSIELVGTSTDAAEARTKLRAGEVDLLIISPPDPLRSLDEGDDAEFTIVHGQVDPIIRGTIRLIARLAVDEVNRRVLQQVVGQAQVESEQIEDPLRLLREGADALAIAIEDGDEEAVRAERERLSAELDRVEQDAGSDLYGSVAEALGTSGEDDAVAGLRADLESTSSADRDEALEGARNLETRLAELEVQLERVQGIDPVLLVSPFGADIQEITELPERAALFYAPGTLMVLIQHLAVTFAALSLVRERQLGLTEVFRASPLRAGEALMGKYLAFFLIAGVVTSALLAAMIGFGVPMRGPWWELAFSVGLVILASLGLGFVISGIAQTDSQAVQYSMIVLLVSIFFSGFVLPLAQLIIPVQTVSFLIPGTYGILALHDVMFRGLSVSPEIYLGLGAYVLVTVLIAWWAVRREVTPLRS